MAMYKSIANTPLQKLQYDQGEDRWLCTLMLTAGGRIEFEASSHCNTFAPEDLDTFYKQARDNFPVNFRSTSGPLPDRKFRCSEGYSKKSAEGGDHRQLQTFGK